jgi:hypothetical protein
MGLEVGGIFGLIIVIADVWAIIHIARSGVAPGHKALWIVLVLVLPILGLVIWLVLGPRGART